LAEDWIDANQLGRRNLTPDQASFFRGRRYNRTKKSEGRPNKLAQNELVISESTAESLGRQHGVSAATIKRDGQFAEVVEKLPGVREQVSKNTSLSIERSANASHPSLFSFYSENSAKDMP